MQKLNFPKYEFSIRSVAKKTQIFDQTRKRYYVLTPEEWVRQHLVEFLVHERNFPRSLLEIEKSLTLNKMHKRADLLVRDKSGNPILLAECKASDVKVTQKTFDQAGRYNMVFRVPYLLITNGVQHFCAQIDFNRNSYKFLREIPSYEEL
ncbi:type I restriction enzyme HsdR N-terminal domain-containing protein [Salibacter halophilus]|uniref:Type I restriction enzyme HsdR N-terminal domain-containing protein n=1 Tax=Salibacter halophilus TaxID=1803916 RepID=A0A6N6M7D8_9FLAO|nr:type I restriction enzyme HsdR N-terminal domain-containing protein [Salibacter halophilus]KAB1062690.1 type I restriction enzyme HsdR N-terminal domain-containing protein [Salibacter halophilus]